MRGREPRWGSRREWPIMVLFHDMDQRAHVRRNLRLCVTPCPTRSCMAMEQRAHMAYLIELYCKMTRKPVQ